MTGFEFLFSFYGLLLGLAVAQVTSSFADTRRRRGNRRLGVVPPILGLFVLLAVAQQWASFWAGRDALDTGHSGRSAALVDGCSDRPIANATNTSSDHQRTLVMAG